MDDKLLAAAELIENNHTTGEMAADNKRCLVGAIAEQYLTEDMINEFRSEWFKAMKGIRYEQEDIPDRNQIIDMLADHMLDDHTGEDRWSETGRGVVAGKGEQFVKALEKVAKVLPPMDGAPLYAEGPDGERVLKDPHAYDNQNHHDTPFAGFRVMHYNDFHCSGGVDAAKILREAAEIE